MTTLIGTIGLRSNRFYQKKHDPDTTYFMIDVNHNNMKEYRFIEFSPNRIQEQFIPRTNWVGQQFIEVTPNFDMDSAARDLSNFLDDCKEALGDHYIAAREGGGPENPQLSVVLSIMKLINKYNKLKS